MVILLDYERIALFTGRIECFVKDFGGGDKILYRCFVAVFFCCTPSQKCHYQGAFQTKMTYTKHTHNIHDQPQLCFHTQSIIVLPTIAAAAAAVVVAVP
jgi:hypothetical protein